MAVFPGPPLISNAAFVAFLNATNTAMGVVANAIQIGTFIIEEINGVSIDPTGELNQILDKVQDIFNAVQGGYTQNKMMNIMDFITPAKDRLTTLQQQTPSGSAVSEPMFFGQ